MIDRRNFLKKAVASTALLTFGGLPSFSAKSYANIMGANDRIRVGAIGVNSRGQALAVNIAKMKECSVDYICDVDTRAIEKCSDAVQKITNSQPKGEKDIRRLLENKDLDAVIIATPDHWHAPAALMAMQAGKDVYLEKPCSHSPQEGEILVKAVKKYNRVLQMGNQRRSWPNVVQAIEEVRSGTIGEVYFGKCWYSNNRPSIGRGKEVPPPEWLDWELWQGPALRENYRDNIVHYNWHWFWKWGTGEALNNGTHMVDLLRWGMDLEYPTIVQSTGGRYHYDDDWECPDTQLINFDFDGKKSMVWEGHSASSYPIEGLAVGALFYGSKGNLLLGGGNSYKVLDEKGKVIKNVESDIKIDAHNLMNPAQQLDSIHIQNFFDGIKKGTQLNSDITSGHISTLLVQLGNIALRSGTLLNTDRKSGHIQGNKDARQYWSRTYEKGWEMKL